MKNFPEGFVVKVKVGERKFSTVIVDGVQRFVENSVVSRFVEASSDEYDRWVRSGRVGVEPFNLNVLTVESHHGKHSLDDLLTFYTSIGYSVSGFADLSFFEGLDIRNPVWEQDHYERISNSAVAELMALIGEPYEHSGNRSTRYFFDAVSDGKWKTDEGFFVSDGDTIDRVLEAFLVVVGLEPWEVEPVEGTSSELREFIEKRWR